MPYDDLFYQRTMGDPVMTTGEDTVVPISRAVNVSV